MILAMILSELVTIGTVILAGLYVVPVTKRPRFDAPWDRYRGRRRHPSILRRVLA